MPNTSSAAPRYDVVEACPTRAKNAVPSAATPMALANCWAAQRRGDDRVVAAPFGDHEQSEGHQRGGDHRVRPRRPAQVASLDERQDQQRRAGGEQAHAEQVETGAAVLATVPGQYAPAECGGEDPERHVDQEDRAPLAAERVQVQQPTGQDRTGDRGQPHDRAERRQRRAQVIRREDDRHERHALRDLHGPEQALAHAGGNQDAGGGREAAGQ
ncbi:MAG TPA: hypothetical protein VGN37_08690 [Actinocatenispora sp.]